MDGGLELVVDDLVLALLEAEAAVRRALGVALELRDLAADGRVLELRLRHQVVELALRVAVVAPERALVQRLNVLHVDAQALDLAADGRYPRQKVALRERVGRGRVAVVVLVLLAVRLHLVLLLRCHGASVVCLCAPPSPINSPHRDAPAVVVAAEKFHG